MKSITFEEWDKRFYRKVFAGPVASGEIELNADDADEFTFYDNGAVKNAEGEFVVTCDQIKTKL